MGFKHDKASGNSSSCTWIYASVRIMDDVCRLWFLGQSITDLFTDTIKSIPNWIAKPINKLRCFESIVVLRSVASQLRLDLFSYNEIDVNSTWLRLRHRQLEIIWGTLLENQSSDLRQCKTLQTQIVNMDLPGVDVILSRQNNAARQNAQVVSVIFVHMLALAGANMCLDSRLIKQLLINDFLMR